jgi:hypothetical protein
MSIRPPGRRVAPDDEGIAGLEHEIRGEQAASLGRSGRLVEHALAALRGFEGTSDDRRPLVRAAAQAVQAYFVQREACGLRRHDHVIADLAIPREVLAALGAA